MHIEPMRLRYKGLIGTGGIGTGAFFALKGDHTLGREESRAGRFLDRRDYCKLHIIAHYVSVLLPPAFRTVPIGMVGDDDAGRRMIAEMRDAGMDVSRVRVAAGEQTLYSFCFVYPDGSGGNMTVDDSASAHVNTGMIDEAEHEFASLARRGIALAAPEVPLEARAELLALATKHHLYRAAAFTSGELAEPLAKAMLKQVDLLALNIDEAATIAGISAHESSERIVAETADALGREMAISVTAGSRGSWIVQGGTTRHFPVAKTQVVSTAGAGDAHFAGLLVGLAAGLALADAHVLATLISGLKVTSLHTINHAIDRLTLAQFASSSGLTIPDAVNNLFKSP